MKIPSAALKFAEMLVDENEFVTGYAIYKSIKNKNEQDVRSLSTYIGQMGPAKQQQIDDDFFQENEVNLLTPNRKTVEGVFLVNNKKIVRGISSKKALYALNKLKAIGGENYLVDCAIIPVDNHPNLAGCMFAEVLPHKNLKDYFDPFPKEQREAIIEDVLPKVLELIHFFHDNNIAFPDLKLSNLFFSSDGKSVIIADPKSLSDLDIELGKVVPADVGCSPGYLPAHMQLKSEESYLELSEHLLDVVIFEMLYGTFDSTDDNQEKMKKVKKIKENAQCKIITIECDHPLRNNINIFDCLLNVITRQSTVLPEKKKELANFYKTLDTNKKQSPGDFDVFEELKYFFNMKLDLLIEEEKNKLAKKFRKKEDDLSSNIKTFISHCERDLSGASIAEKEQILCELHDTNNLYLNPSDDHIRNYQEKYKDSPRARETNNIPRRLDEAKGVTSSAPNLLSLSLIAGKFHRLKQKFNGTKDPSFFVTVGTLFQGISERPSSNGEKGSICEFKLQN